MKTYVIKRIDDERFGLSEYEDGELDFYTIIELSEIPLITASYTRHGIMGEIIF